MRKRRILSFCLILITVFLSACAGDPVGDKLAETAKILNSYEIDASYNDKTHTVTVVETVRYKNSTGGALDKLCFNLYPNAYRENAKYKAIATAERAKAYPRGASWGGAEINYIKENGTPAHFFIEGDDDNILSVALSDPLPENGETAVEIGFTVTLANVYDRLGYNDKTVNITNFYPSLCVFKNGAFSYDNYCSYGDPFFSESANFKVNFTYPKNYTASFTGDKLGEKENNGQITLSAEVRCARDFAVSLSLEGKTVSAVNADGVEVKYNYIADKNPDGNLALAVKVTEDYADFFGGYPYNKIEICETPFVHGGMEYSGLILAASGLSDLEYKEVIAHELAHQWWYAAVGNDQHREAWLDEGLSDYATLLFFERRPEYGIDKEKRIKTSEMNYALFVDVLGAVSKTNDTTMTRALFEYSGEREYAYMNYVKGMLLFDALAKSLGKNTFIKCLKKYYEEYLFKIASAENLIAVFEKTARRPLNSFFRSWLDGKVVIARLAG